MSYEELEEAMMNVKSINRDKYERLRQNNTHKMNPIPVCKLPKEV
jgi:NAD+ synthase